MANPRWTCRNGTVKDLRAGVVVHTHRSMNGLYSLDPHYEADLRADHSRWLCIAVNDDQSSYAFIWLEDCSLVDIEHPSPVPKRGWLSSTTLADRMKSDNIRIEESA